MKLRKDGQRLSLSIAPAVWIAVSVTRDFGVHRLSNPYLVWGIRLLGSLVVLMQLAEVLISRWEAGEDGITAYSLLNRSQWSMAYADILVYKPMKGTWFLVTKAGVKATTNMAQGDVHRVIAEHAPRALLAKRWRCGQVPPSQEIRRGLLEFRPPSFSLGILFGSSVAYLAGGGRGKDPLFAYLALGVALALFAYDMRNVFGRLELTSEAITARWPWETRTIRWTDVTAIFMEGSRKDRHYVVTSTATSIVVPHSVARELEPMRKLFYSLPNGTRCVNFDETFRTGLRRRRRKGLGFLRAGMLTDQDLTPVGF